MKISLTLALLFCTQVFAQTFKATTYNLGLAHTFVPYAEERLSPLKEKLAHYDADVLCLQEVWKKSDQRKLTKVLKKRYPHHFVTKIKNYRTGPRPTCKKDEIFGEGKFVSCMQNQCGDASGDDFTTCIINKCGNALQALKKTNRNCASALMAQVGKNPLLSMAQLLNPLWRAGQFAYKGSNGLMLFSKHPLEKKRYIDMKEISTLNRRSALEAQVEIGGKKITVMCTHLSADLTGTAPYAGGFDSWAEENSKQIDFLLNEINKSVLPTVLMGDFNCGSADPMANLSGELDQNCEKFSDWGFLDPLKEETRECTFCEENLLNDEGSKSVAIDHVFLKYLTPVSGRVLFKSPIEIETKEGKKTTNLSDHYGYEVEIELP